MSGVVTGDALPFDVLDLAREACARDSEVRFRWDGARPREVRVRWTGTNGTLQATVPVMDEYGRFAAGSLAGLGLDGAAWELAGFPAIREDDDDGADDDDADDPEKTKATAAPPAGTRSYPIRQMMQLIEHIAERQCALDELDWAAWCHRLEQVLMQASGNAAVAEFVKLDINPLAALYVPSFRPDYAETRQCAAGLRYEQALARVEQAWGVAGLLPIGGSA